jgi:hypothetical protein
MPESNQTLHLTVVGIEQCRRAQELKRRLRSAARDVGILIDIEEADDMLDPLRYALLGLPGLLIEGQFIMAGRVPSEKELARLLLQHASAKVQAAKEDE